MATRTARTTRAPRPAGRSERERSLERIQAERLALAARSLWMKRASVAGVVIPVGVGALQEWPLLQLLAIPAALLCWWRDAGITRADRRLDRLYEAVTEGAAPPPSTGEEEEAADSLPEPADAFRRALLSGPGVSLHLLMIGIAVLFNLLG